MSESMQYGSTTSSTPSQSPSLEAAASEFRSKVEEAASRLSGAAEQFVAMSEGLLSAVEEARAASEKAQAAQRSVEELKSQMARDYGNVSDLVRDLQQRIGALATLAQPMPSSSSASSETAAPTSAPQTVSAGYSTQSFGSPGESSW